MADFRFESAEDLNILGTPSVRYKQNLRALRILKDLEKEPTTSPTPQDLTSLSRYVGWGSSELINKAFPRGTSVHLKPAQEISDLLTEDEISALRSSSLTAFYTPLPVIAALYEALDYLGLSSLPPLKVLDPATGTGNFLGAMPQDIKGKADCVAVELDTISANIAKVLYPSAKIYQKAFEETKFPQNFFDLVIGNIPFGDFRVADATIKERYLKAQIHDYFFVKALSLTRPGGLVAFITSTGTLDKKDDRVRRHLCKHAELLTALRLPNNAFKQNAGTEVVTDLIILRKRAHADESAPNREAWVQTLTAPYHIRRGGTAETVINRHFIDDPSRILGLPIIEAGMYQGSEQLTVKSDGRDLRTAIIDAVKAVLPANLLAPSAPSASSTAQSVTQASSQDARGEIESGGALFTSKQKDGARAAALVDIYAAAKNVLNLQLLDADDALLQSAQATLNRAYDRFTIQFGYINSKENTKAFRRDNPFVSFLRALEDRSPAGGYTKSKIFNTRTIKPNKKATFANNAKEALLHCLNERGSIDLDFIATLARTTIPDAINSLKGLIFQTPSREWLTADEYLSGNVKARLIEAEAAAALDPAFQENVDALRTVQPRPLGPGEIAARLGAAWIPEDVIETYITQLVPDYKGKVQYLAPIAKWVVTAPDFTAATSFEATQKWGTQRAHAIDLVEDALNLRRTAIYDEQGIGKDKKKILNQVETAAAQAKLSEIKEHFMEWVWQDAAREQRLCKIYNEQFNTYRERRFNGAHLTLPGSSTEVSLRPHQKDGIWRALQCQTALFNHKVGSGKAQPLTANLLTPTGWKRMGDIRVGDLVISVDGTPTKVTGVYPQGPKEMFRVTFSDGAQTECCDEHLWYTTTYLERNQISFAKMKGRQVTRGAVRSLAEIRQTLTARFRIKNHTIPLVSPVHFTPQPVPINPYLLGVLLGDACLAHNTIHITTHDAELIRRCTDLLPEKTEFRRLTSDPHTYSVARSKGRGFGQNNRLLDILRSLDIQGKKAYKKFIPDIYKFNNTDVRLAILQGLMDTDGTVQKNGMAVSFASASKRLAEDVRFLVQSLGGTAKITTKIPTYTHNGRRCLGSMSYRVGISLPPQINPFRLHRKASLVRPKTKYLPTRYIVSVEPIGRTLAQCISVDHPSRLYVTDNFIVTHNTFIGIASAMELRRLGLARKPVVVVPKIAAPGWASQAQTLYPGIKLLTTDVKDFTKENRGETLSRIATGDWDLIVVPHPSFKLLPVIEATFSRFVQEEINRLRSYILDLEAEDDRKHRSSIKQLERQAKKLEARLKEDGSDIRRDDARTITFEEMGIDALIVDEFDMYKNLGFATKMSRIAGLPNSDSQQAFDMFMKIRYMLEHGGRMIALTGTAVSNTIAEVYTLQRYLQLELLEELGIAHFDAWAQMFADTTTGFELKVDGSGYRQHTRFAKFVNLPELSRILQQVVDIRNEKDLDLPLPRLAGGGPIIVGVEPSGAQQEYTKLLADRADNIKKGSVKASEDNMLLVTSDGRKAALDIRLVMPDKPEDPDSKINQAVERIYRYWERTHANRGTQTLFLDLSTPKGTGTQSTRAARQSPEYDEAEAA